MYEQWIFNNGTKTINGGKKTLFSGAGLMDEVGPPTAYQKEISNGSKVFFNVRVNTIKLLDTKSLCPWIGQ